MSTSCSALAEDVSFFFFFNDTATTEIYTLSLHDALPIFEIQDLALATGYEVSGRCRMEREEDLWGEWSPVLPFQTLPSGDRKSTRLNSSHANISYAVFCLKKKQNVELHSLQCDVSGLPIY